MSKIYIVISRHFSGDDEITKLVTFSEETATAYCKENKNKVDYGYTLRLEEHILDVESDDTGEIWYFYPDKDWSQYEY